MAETVEKAAEAVAEAPKSVWFKNKETGFAWEVSHEDTINSLRRDIDFEEVSEKDAKAAIKAALAK